MHSGVSIAWNGNALCSWAILLIMYDGCLCSYAHAFEKVVYLLLVLWQSMKCKIFLIFEASGQNILPFQLSTQCPDVSEQAIIHSGVAWMYGRAGVFYWFYKGPFFYFPCFAKSNYPTTVTKYRAGTRKPINTAGFCFMLSTRGFQACADGLLFSILVFNVHVCT